MSDKCKSCKAPIRWVTIKRKACPVDRAPTSTGNLELISDSFAVVLTPIEVSIARLQGTRLYTSHFATCPNAAAHRQPR